jgi:hypothetical protein
MIIGNIPKEIRRQPSRRAYILLIGVSADIPICSPPRRWSKRYSDRKRRWCGSPWPPNRCILYWRLPRAIGYDLCEDRLVPNLQPEHERLGDGEPSLLRNFEAILAALGTLDEGTECNYLSMTVRMPDCPDARVLGSFHLTSGTLIIGCLHVA